VARWDLVTTNLAGAVTGQIDAPSELKYIRRESDYCEINFNTLDPHDLNLIALHNQKCKIQAWRNGDLVFWGNVSDPLVITQDGAEVVAKDAFAKLQAPTRTKYTFDNKDLRYIAETVIGGETAWAPRDIAFGSEDVSDVLMDRQITPGQRMDEFLKACTSISTTTGAWFRMDALNDVDNPSAMHFGVGSDRVVSTARFEYGPDTIDNVSEFQVETRGVINRVVVYNNNTHVTVQDTDSIDDYGLHERWYRRPGVNHVETLTDIAYGKLQPDPFSIASFTPTPDGPKIFDDYDVGQVVSCWFQLEGGEQHYKSTSVIPVQIEVTVDDSGIENIGFQEGSALSKGRAHVAEVQIKHKQRKHRHEHAKKPKVEAYSTFTLQAGSGLS
jgi:hypothetical protein